MYCDGRSPSPFREFEPFNFAIATGRLTSEAFSKSSGSRHKVAHSSRMVDYLVSVHSTQYSPYFVEKTSVKTILNCFYPRFPVRGAIKEKHERTILV